MCRLLAGLKNTIVWWDVTRPGRTHSTIKTKSSAGQQRGIISALAVPSSGDLLAAGSFGGSVGVYDFRSKAAQMLLAGHCGGITHIQFSRWAPT